MKMVIIFKQTKTKKIEKRTYSTQKDISKCLDE